MLIAAVDFDVVSKKNAPGTLGVKKRISLPAGSENRTNPKTGSSLTISESAAPLTSVRCQSRGTLTRINRVDSLLIDAYPVLDFRATRTESRSGSTNSSPMVVGVSFAARLSSVEKVTRSTIPSRISTAIAEPEIKRCIPMLHPSFEGVAGAEIVLLLLASVVAFDDPCVILAVLCFFCEIWTSLPAVLFFAGMRVSYSRARRKCDKVALIERENWCVRI